MQLDALTVLTVCGQSVAHERVGIRGPAAPDRALGAPSHFRLRKMLTRLPWQARAGCARAESVASLAAIVTAIC